MMTEAEELQMLRQIHKDVTKDPEIRRKFQRILKEARPNIVIPELDQEEALNARLAKEKEAMEARIQKLEEEKLRADLEAKYNGQKAALAGPPFNFDEEDIREVEKLIKDKEFPSYQAAAEYYKAVTSPVRPSGLGLGGSSRSKSIREQRKAFNDRFKGVFKRQGNGAFQATFDDAYQKALNGQYLNE